MTDQRREELKKLALKEHERLKGKIGIELRAEMKTLDDLAVYYSPGVAEPCKEIAKDTNLSYKYTGRGNAVAVISDGSAVLGLGNIGPEAGMPVMEGKAALFKAFGDIDATAVCIDAQESEDIIKFCEQIAPSVGGINLEDISAPRCFEIERALIEKLDIPVFHDDQHGTAVVCLAGMINALKIVDKKPEDMKIVVSGAGAAGIAITQLFMSYGFKNFILLDSKGCIYKGRDRLNWIKEEMAEVTNKEMIQGGLEEALKDADVFIGVSQPGIVSKEMVKSMKKDPIIFAMSNPVPEIFPEDALEAGAKIVATGRSDYPNQINNVLVFPGIFRGALDARATKITEKMKLEAAKGLAALVKNPTADRIIPGAFDEGVCEAVANAVKSCS
jgi:malate dehydrogenase (oxaloacetate-decarboxylating)